ncbi:UNVERIFIED_CONTAM: hypothetical protein FKN15_022995 [Acipenser sinensis]
MCHATSSCEDIPECSATGETTAQCSSRWTKSHQSASPRQRQTALVSTYSSDWDGAFPAEMLHFAEFVVGKEKMTASDILRLILNAPVISTFLNVATTLHIYLSLMCTNCSFSRMGLIKNELRATMGQDHLNCLAITDILRKLDFSDIVKGFAKAKSRGRTLLLSECTVLQCSTNT